MSKKIFVIDNDSFYLHSLEAMLRVSDFQVMIDNGHEEGILIIKKIRDFKPDYIVLDLFHAKKNIFLLLRDIKSSDDLSSIPVFAFSSLLDDGDKSFVKNLHAEYCYFKNELNVEDFVKKIKKIISNREDNKVILS